MPTVTEALAPKNGAPFATHVDQLGRGGYRSVADASVRDAIPLDRRQLGMLVRLESTGVYYRKGLPVASDGASWIIEVFGGPGSADKTLRSFVVPIGAPSDFYVETTGNDDNDGTLAFPFATLERAIQATATMNPAPVTVHMGAGTYAMPLMLVMAHYITVQGSISDGTALTTMAVISAAAPTGLVVDVTGIAMSLVDAHVGKLVEWTSGALVGKRGHVYRSNASVGADTRLHVSLDDPDTIVSPGPLDTLKFISRDTVLEWAAPGVVTSSSQLLVRDCHLTGAGVDAQRVRWAASDRVQFEYCLVELETPIAGESSTVVWKCCAIASKGSTVGMLAVELGGQAHLECGTVILADFAATATSRRNVQIDGGRLFTRGQVVWRGLVDGVVVNRADVVVDDEANPWHGWLFEPGPWLTAIEPTGTPSNAKGIAIDGTISEVRLPHLYGEVGTAYAVIQSASSCGCTRLPASSSIRTTTINKAVSADGGVSAVSEEQHSIIYGGAPDSRRIMPQADGLGTIGDTSRRWGKVRAVEVETGDLILRSPAGRPHPAHYRIIEYPNGLIVLRDEMTGAHYRFALERLDPQEIPK